MNSTETIKCGNCGRDSGIRRDENDGVNAFALKRIGWISKLPVLVGISEWLFTCSLECKAQLFKTKCDALNISQEEIDAANNFVEESKKKIPEMARQTGIFMNKLVKILNERKTEK